MNRMSSQQKYILKDGKYTVQQKQDGQLQSQRARSEVANSLESSKHTNIRTTMDGHPPIYHSARPNLAAEMTCSAIYPRKTEGLPKQLQGRRLGQNLVTSAEHSPLKLMEMDRQSNLVQAAKQLKVAFETMRCDAKSNQSQDQNNQTQVGNLTTLEAQTHLDGKNTQEMGVDDKVLELTVVNRELTQRLRQFHRKEIEQKYRMSPQQQVMWLKRTLEDRNTQFEKVINQNNRLRNDVLFLKERILSLQRTNHILEIQNARNKTQLFTQDELIEICCPEENKGTFAQKDKSILSLETQIQNLKAELQKQQTDKSNSKYDTRSEIVSPRNTHKVTPQQEKIANLKKHICERSNILDALRYGNEKKDTLKKYITNIVERLGGEQKTITQLQNQVKGKEAIIQEMDSIVMSLNDQLVACKKDLSEQFKLQDSFHQMRQSMITATSFHNQLARKQPSSLTNSRFDGYCESPPKQARLSLDAYQPRYFDTSPDKRRAERFEKVETQIVEDGQYTIKMLEKECNHKQKLIDRYQLEIVRLNKMIGAQLGICSPPHPTDRRYSVEHQTDYTPTIHQVSSSLKLKKKHIGGQNSKTSIISIKRASVV